MTNHWSSRLSVALSMLFLNTAFPQQKVTLTVEKCIEIGMENSKSLHSSLMRVQAADAKSSEAFASRLPTLKASGSYNRLSDIPPFDMAIPASLFGPGLPPQSLDFVVSQTILSNYNVRFSLQQPLFTGFRLESSAQMADYAAQAASQDFNKDKSDLVYSIRNAYWNLYKALEFKKVIDENVEQMNAHLSDVQSFFNQGIVTKNEVLRVEVQLSNAQNLQLDAQNNMRLASLALDNVIGLSLDREIDVQSEIQPQSKSYQEVDKLVQSALSNRPELKAMQFRVGASQSGVILAKSGWLPQIYLTGNYYYARPNARIIPSVDQFKDTWDFGISASLDIWNWGTTIHQTTQAQAQLAQAQDTFAQLRDAVQLEVTQSYLNLHESKEKVDVAGKGVNQAEENYHITDEKFKSGLALNSDLLDAEVALLQAKWNYIQALVESELADARLQKATGTDSPAPKE